MLWLQAGLVALAFALGLKLRLGALLLLALLAVGATVGAQRAYDWSLPLTLLVLVTTLTLTQLSYLAGAFWATHRQPHSRMPSRSSARE
ncbi:MAG: hypothetical protein KDJ41_14780 [Hyphomicrobiaceae bacterium]|nr:hypothetical protein [Hyphomicrobiaceae bacterium]